MAKKKARQYATASQLTRIDYLLSAEAPKLSVITGELKNNKPERKAKPVEKQHIEVERHKLMSDVNIKYFYEEGSQVIHDKTCLDARQIPLEKLCTSEEYFPEMVQCPKCMEKAYIRAGGRATQVTDYLLFFNKIGVDENMMRRIYIDNQAVTELSGNSMTIKINEETWIWRLLDERSNSIELLHNRFNVREKQRTIMPGFYTVFSKVEPQQALAFIEKYCWQGNRCSFSLKRWSQKTWFGFVLWREKIGKWIKTLRNVFSLHGTRHIYYIDGDNCPSQRMRGIDLLTEKDIVKIFHVRTATYYNYQRRADIKDRYVCNVKFVPVKPGHNATDFAIGLDAYDALLQNRKTKVYLISGDKHFDVITNQIKALLGPATQIVRGECIRDVRK